jgi:hypothetical protein
MTPVAANREEPAAMKKTALFIVFASIVSGCAYYRTPGSGDSGELAGAHHRRARAGSGLRVDSQPRLWSRPLQRHDDS